MDSQQNSVRVSKNYNKHFLNFFRKIETEKPQPTTYYKMNITLVPKPG